MTQIWIGLISGIAFGFVIQRVGATNPQKMFLAHLMRERYIPQFMLLVVIFAAIGLFALEASGGGLPDLCHLVSWLQAWEVSSLVSAGVFRATARAPAGLL